MAGSRKGIPNKARSLFRVALRDYCNKINANPFQFLADVIVDEAAELALRTMAAKELAQYMEPKLRAMQVTGHGDGPLTHEVQVKWETLPHQVEPHDAD